MIISIPKGYFNLPSRKKKLFILIQNKILSFFHSFLIQLLMNNDKNKGNVYMCVYGLSTFRIIHPCYIL